MTKQSNFEKQVARRLTRLEQEGEVTLLKHVDSQPYYDHLVDKGLATCEVVMDGQVLIYTYVEQPPEQLSFVVKT